MAAVFVAAAGILATTTAATTAAAGEELREDWFKVTPNQERDAAWQRPPQGAAPSAAGPRSLDRETFTQPGGTIPAPRPTGPVPQKPLPPIVREDGRWPLVDGADPTAADPDDEWSAPLPSVPLDRHWTDQQQIRRAGVDQEDMLLKRLADLNDPLAPDAAFALGRIQVPKGRQALRDALRGDPRTDVRLAAVRTLARFEPLAEDRPYRALLLDEREAPLLRAEAALWAGKRRDMDCHAALMALRREPGSPFTEYAASWALARLGERVGWEYLRLALSQPELEEPARWAVQGLGEMENTEALPLLYPLLERESPLRELAVLALERYPDNKRDEYLATLPREERVMRIYRWLLLRYAMGRQTEPPPDMGRVLNQGREEDRMLALEGLTRSGTGTDIPLLLELLNNEERRLGSEMADDGRSSITPTHIRHTLRAVATRAGLTGMPGPSVPDAPHRPAGLELPDNNRMWRYWWYGQFRVVSNDGVRARIRDPLGVTGLIDGDSTLAGGALVESINVDGRGTVRLILGKGSRVDLLPWSGEEVRDGSVPVPSPAPGIGAPPATGAWPNAGESSPPPPTRRRWAD